MNGLSLLAVSAALLLVSPAVARRSAGYAGSLPDGQVTGAFGTGDCSKLNGAPSLGHLLVPFFEECAMVVPSPDRRFSLQKRANEAALNIFDGRKRLLTIPLTQPAVMMWNPSSTGFFVNDGDGSGQSSRFRYFRVFGGKWQESDALNKRAEQLFLHKQDCRPGAYVNVSGIAWTRGGLVKAVIQEGVHSVGCLEPSDGDIALEIIADPLGKSVRLQRVRVDR